MLGLDWPHWSATTCFHIPALLIPESLPGRSGAVQSKQCASPARAGTAVSPSSPGALPGMEISSIPFTQPLTLCQIYLPAISLQSSDLFACHLDKC